MMESTCVASSIVDLQFLTIIGGLTLIYFAVKLSWNIYHVWKVYLAPTYPDFSKYGKWSGTRAAFSFTL